MEYVRRIDFSAFPAEQRSVQQLLGRDSGGQTCRIFCNSVPPGGGSPEGTHTHTFEQIYYCISGIMELEIEDQRLKGEPGSLVFIPEGVPHRNWNSGTAPLVFLALMVPEPEPGQQVAQRVEAQRRP